MRPLTLLKVEDNILPKIELVQLKIRGNILPVVENGKKSNVQTAKYHDFASRLKSLMDKDDSPIKTVNQLKDAIEVTYEMARRYTLGVAKPREEKMQILAEKFMMNSIFKFPSSLQKFEWNVKGGERDLWKYVLQFRASGVRVKRRTTAPSLIAMTDTQVPIIAWQKRYMTPEECARLQSLDELKALPSTPTKAFHALGNAVNSTVVERVARALLADMSGNNSMHAGGKVDHEKANA